MDIFYDTDVYNINEPTSGKRIYENKVEKSKISILLLEGSYNEPSIEFLASILKAINFKIDSDCILREFNRSDNIALNKIVLKDSSRFVLSFGIDKNSFNTQANVIKYKWNHFDSFSLIFTDTLDDIKSNINLKRNLWVELKKVFNE